MPTNAQAAHLPASTQVSSSEFEKTAWPGPCVVVNVQTAKLATFYQVASTQHVVSQLLQPQHPACTCLAFLHAPIPSTGL
jgi:hypothetical protein